MLRLFSLFGLLQMLIVMVVKSFKARYRYRDHYDYFGLLWHILILGVIGIFTMGFDRALEELQRTHRYENILRLIRARIPNTMNLEAVVRQVLENQNLTHAHITDIREDLAILEQRFKTITKRLNRHVADIRADMADIRADSRDSYLLLVKTVNTTRSSNSDLPILLCHGTDGTIPVTTLTYDEVISKRPRDRISCNDEVNRVLVLLGLNNHGIGINHNAPNLEKKLSILQNHVVL